MNSTADLVNLGGLVAGGLTELGVTLDLHYVQADAFTLEMADLILKHGLHQTGKQLMNTRHEAVRLAFGNCSQFIRVTRDVLKPVLGYTYSNNWAPLGFTNGLSIPARIAPVNTMMQAIRGYLTANPTKENAGANVTAAQATILFNALNTAQQALATHEMNLETLITNRDAQATLVRGRVRQLTKELTNVLTPMDARWLRFGLNQPGLKERPGIPGKVAVTLRAGNVISVKWKAAIRAERYRVWMKIVGVDADALLVGSPADLSFTIENLPAGATVEISVSAVNNGGESVRSEVLTVSTL